MIDTHFNLYQYIFLGWSSIGIVVVLIATIFLHHGILEMSKKEIRIMMIVCGPFSWITWLIWWVMDQLAE